MTDNQYGNRDSEQVKIPVSTKQTDPGNWQDRDCQVRGCTDNDYLCATMGRSIAPGTEIGTMSAGADKIQRSIALLFYRRGPAPFTRFFMSQAEKRQRKGLVLSPDDTLAFTSSSSLP